MSVAKPPLSRLLVNPPSPPPPKVPELTFTQVCGLGNPGSGYAHTRHSVGHLLIDALRSHWGYPAWRRDAKVQGCWSGETGNCVLFKPNTFMNGSGRPVSAAYRKMALRDTARVVVIYDDLELAVGEVKLRTMGKGKYQTPLTCE
jgi:peptidyl-tRNA hydrolase, PTH1 family